MSSCYVTVRGSRYMNQLFELRRRDVFGGECSAQLVYRLSGHIDWDRHLCIRFWEKLRCTKLRVIALSEPKETN